MSGKFEIVFYSLHTYIYKTFLNFLDTLHIHVFYSYKTKFHHEYEISQKAKIGIYF